MHIYTCFIDNSSVINSSRSNLPIQKFIVASDIHEAELALKIWLKSTYGPAVSYIPLTEFTGVLPI